MRVEKQHQASPQYTLGTVGLGRGLGLLPPTLSPSLKSPPFQGCLGCCFNQGFPICVEHKWPNELAPDQTVQGGELQSCPSLTWRWPPSLHHKNTIRQIDQVPLGTQGSNADVTIMKEVGSLSSFPKFPFIQRTSYFNLACTHACSVNQSCPTHCNPMDSSPPGSSVHGISQARTLEPVAMPSSRGSSWVGDRSNTHLLHRQENSLPLKGNSVASEHQPGWAEFKRCRQWHHLQTTQAAPERTRRPTVPSPPWRKKTKMWKTASWNTRYNWLQNISLNTSGSKVFWKGKPPPSF